MKKLVNYLMLAALYILFIPGCNSLDDNFDDVPCRMYEGQQLWKEPDGRCYFINNDGHKVYVVEAECNCDQ